MTLTGRVQDGVIVLDTPGVLPEGVLVRIERVEAEEDAPMVETYWEEFGSVIGKVVDLPPDSSKHIDHYLYGAPKQ
jgi:hypothetical protein